MRRLLTITAFFLGLISFSQTDEIDRLTIELAYQKQDTTKVKTSLQLIESLYDSRNYKKALLYLDQTDQLAETLNYTVGLAETNYYRALIYSDEGDYINAFDNFTKSRKYYQDIQDELGIAKVKNNIGIIEIKRGNYEEGFKNSLSAISVFEKENLHEELSMAYNNLADAYLKAKMLDKALEYNFKALNARKTINDSTGIKNSTKNIAVIYSMQGQHANSITYFENVMALLDPEEDNNLKIEILPRLGDEYLRLNDIETAGKYLVDGLRQSRRTNNKEGIIRSLNSMGNLNLLRGKIQLANTQLNEAYELAKDSEFKTELLKNYRLHKELDSTRDYFQNAFFWQRKYYTLKDEILKENESISLLGEKFEPEITELIDEREPAQHNLSSNTSKSFFNFNLITYILGALLLLCLGGLAYLLFNRGKKNKLDDELNEKINILQQQIEGYEEQVKQLEESNQVKDRLFSIVSHDLKDSISSIKGFLDLLHEDSISREEFYNLVPELSENANNASLLLFNLLNWSKSQMQSLESHPELFNIQEIFKDKLHLVEQKAEEKRIVVIDESQRDFVYADKSMIEIVIQNLITNAVKFSRVGDIITVTNKDVEGKCLITIEDTGIGISEDNITKLFKKNNFTTIGTKNEKGTGLGLVICKELVELNNGRIWVESNQNVGTKFYVELPKSKPKVR